MSLSLIVDPAGNIRAIYGEEIELATLGTLEISRASRVEPSNAGNWTANLSLIGGPVLGPFERRSEAIRAEVTWLAQNWLK